MSDTPRVDDDYPTYQATIPADLRQQIMSSCVPKNEREHWAAREIEKLEAENAELKKLIEQMRTTLIAARNGLLIACDDNENDSRVKRFFGYIDSALAAERGE